MREFDVADYEILEIDGQVPKVGILASTGSGLVLIGHDTVLVADPPPELRDKIGAKIWIVGPGSGPDLSVLSYGVIRE